jgi:hypothetical protein
MTEILSSITPLSRGLIWLRHEEMVNSSQTYKCIDYMLDGLLTATLNATKASPHGLLVGKNFGKDFYVYIPGPDMNKNEFTSFYNLLSPLLTAEEDILIIDENESHEKLFKLTPEEIKKRFKIIK